MNADQSRLLIKDSQSNKTLCGRGLDEIAIERLRTFEESALAMAEDGYYVAYSGGKDSDVILDLVRRSGVKYTAHHALTTADPPEVVRHVKEQADVIIHRPKHTMWQLIRQHHCPPRRNMRYCCETQKEAGGTGHVVVTGIRWAESSARSARGMVESCYRDPNKKYLNVIIDWSTEEVWSYIREHNIKVCSLYAEGFTRLGCVLCPMVRDVEIYMNRWPKICRAWERAIKATYNPAKGAYGSPEEYWQWWLHRDAKTCNADGVPIREAKQGQQALFK